MWSFLKSVSTLQTHKITHHKLQKTKFFHLYYMHYCMANFCTKKRKQNTLHKHSEIRIYLFKHFYFFHFNSTQFPDFASLKIQMQLLSKVSPLLSEFSLRMKRLWLWNRYSWAVPIKQIIWYDSLHNIFLVFLLHWYIFHCFHCSLWYKKGKSFKDACRKWKSRHIVFCNRLWFVCFQFQNNKEVSLQIWSHHLAIPQKSVWINFNSAFVLRVVH